MYVDVCKIDVSQKSRAKFYVTNCT